MQIDAQRRTIKELFTAGGQLTVPPYQRPYAWGAQQIDQFWDDIQDAGTGGHFLGPLVIYKKDAQTRELIDGQQRLTTVQMLLALIRDRYVALDSPNAMNPHSLLFETAYALGDDRFRFRSGKRNWLVLRDFILRHPNDEEGKRRFIDNKQHKKELPKVEWQKNKSLVAAYRRLAEKLDDHLSHATDKVAALNALEKTLVFTVDTVAIEVEGLADAFLLFETLNDRGLSLSAADLLKSHLLAKLDAQHNDDQMVHDASEQWDDLVEELGGGDITRYLRHYLLMTRKKVRKSDIFEEFQEEVREVGPGNLLEELRKMGARYAQFSKPELAEQEEVREVLADLQGINAVTHYVALLPARRWLPDAEFVRFARLAEALSFRWIVAGMNAQELETIYQQAAGMLHKSKGDQLHAAIAHLQEQFPNDANFAEQFRHQRMGTKYVARYMLRRIENSHHPTGEFHLKPNGDVHIEHIMPRGSTDYWDTKVRADQDYETVVERWGNLTLLHSQPNQKLQNGPWYDPADADRPTDKRRGKRGYFADSEVVLTSALAEVEDWDVARIDLRQQWLALAATRVWSLDAVEGKDLMIPSFGDVLRDPLAYGLEIDTSEDDSDAEV